MFLSQNKETIVAIATPPGEGGVAIIRISGNEARQIASKIFSGPVLQFKSHTVHFGTVLNEGKKVDEALLIVMEGPKSYTGEDVVEIQCHGGVVASTQVLETALKAGGKMARPGEFTFRAFLNGKLDLTQAEAVQGLIAAKSEVAFAMASKQLEGALSRKIQEINGDLLFLAALFEAWVDFPDEGLELDTWEEALKKMRLSLEKIERLLSTFNDGEKLNHGIKMCIMGAPNVGKSSLMNVLAEKDKAIVTPIAGTTRDIIECEFVLNGLLFQLIDTAGIRTTSDVIETEGIKRSKLAMKNADLVLLVLDAEKGIAEEEALFWGDIDHNKTIAVWNKIDKGEPKGQIELTHVVAISAKEHIGIELLKEKIDAVIKSKSLAKDEVILTSVRHKECLRLAKGALEKTLEGLKRNAYQEVLSYELRFALFELGKILGTNVSEDILSTIFSNFCIGK